MNNESAANSFCFFGKLPQFPDFIRYKSSSEEFITFDNWLQGGISSAKLNLGSSWKDQYSSSENVDFFFPVINSEFILTGTLHPSSDKSGRQFPFVVFSVLPKSFFSPDQTGTLPLILNSIFYKAKQLYSLASRTLEINDIVNEFNKSEIRLNSASAAENIFSEYLSTTTISDLLARIQFEKSFNSNSEIPDSNSALVKFISDEENYNFDTGFFLYFSHLLFSQSKGVPYFFKSFSNTNEVTINIYFNQPDANEFTRIIAGSHSSAWIIDPLFNDVNPGITLKELTDNIHFSN